MLNPKHFKYLKKNEKKILTEYKKEFKVKRLNPEGVYNYFMINSH